MAPLGPFTADRRVVLAVSGGVDSMALAWLAAGWGRPSAVIVDHGLRPEAAAEAALTAGRLATLGVPARILRAGLAPGSAAAERARDARYRLLLQACRDAGCADLLIAHHADDQAETVRMREAAGSAVAGLAGMAAVAYRAEARLLRPLLGLRQARLRATATAAGLHWVEDPSNRDLRTERARLRATMSAEDRAAALALASRAAKLRGEAERAAAVSIASVQIRPEGFAVVAAPIHPDALSALVWTLSGHDHPPPRRALEPGLAARTSHGVLFRPAGRLGPGTLVAREPEAVAAPVAALEGAVWDGRFRLGADAAGLTLGALGADAARFRRRSSLPSVVLRSLPALRRGETLVAVPHLAYPDRATGDSLEIGFAPARPAAGAPFR